MAKVWIDEEACIACGVCSDLCPDIFEEDDESAKVIDENPDDMDCAQEAADSCPTEAIHIEEE